jgi:hypothetical protein
MGVDNYYMKLKRYCRGKSCSTETATLNAESAAQAGTLFEFGLFLTGDVADIVHCVNALVTSILLHLE